MFVTFSTAPLSDTVGEYAAVHSYAAVPATAPAAVKRCATEVHAGSEGVGHEMHEEQTSVAGVREYDIPES